MSLVAWFDLTVAAAIGALAVHWLVERIRLRRFVESLGSLPEDPTQRALQLASRISNRPFLPSDPPYITRLLRPLGATPGDLIRHGGCCSGTARLYILCLDILGIKAHQITVYHRDGNAQHCMVEADLHLPKGKLIADPLYGVYYVDPSDRLLSLEDLQAGVPVTCRLMPGTSKKGYLSNGYYDFDFSITKTANWTRTWPRRVAYAVLRLVTGDNVDRLRLPVILEWPQVLLSMFLVGVIACVHSVLALVGHLGAI